MVDNYKVNMDGEYITGLTTNTDKGNISRAEFDKILALIRSKNKNSRIKKTDEGYIIETKHTEAQPEVITPAKIAREIFGDNTPTREDLDNIIKARNQIARIKEALQKLPEKLTLGALKKLLEAIKAVI